MSWTKIYGKSKCVRIVTIYPYKRFAQAANDLISAWRLKLCKLPSTCSLKQLHSRSPSCSSPPSPLPPPRLPCQSGGKHGGTADKPILYEELSFLRRERNILLEKDNRLQERLNLCIIKEHRERVEKSGDADNTVVTQYVRRLFTVVVQTIKSPPPPPPDSILCKVRPEQCNPGQIQ